MSPRSREPRVRSAAADWVARGMVVAGGFMLVRLIQPRPQQAADGPATGDDDAIGTEDEQLGRGEPTVPPSSKARKAGHETLDLSGRTLAILTAGLGGTVAVVIVAMILLRGYFVSRIDAGNARFTAEQTTSVTPPLPHLQVTPLEEIAALHGREDALLQHYGYVDADRTRARIPISRAMTLIVGHKLDTAP